MVFLPLLFALFTLLTVAREMDTSVKQDAVEAHEDTSSAWNTIAQDVVHIYTELANNSPANMTLPDGEHPQIAWNIGAVLVAALLVLLPAGCCGLCAWKHYHQQTFSQIQQRPGYSLLLPEVAGDSEPLHKVLRREVLLMLACPALALLAGPWTTCAEGCPTWIYVLYLPILLRSKWVEWHMMLNWQVKGVFVWENGRRNGWVA